jgi:hypothetical protein
VDAVRGERAGERDKAGFVGDGEKGAANGAHGDQSYEMSGRWTQAKRLRPRRPTHPERTRLPAPRFSHSLGSENMIGRCS